MISLKIICDKQHEFSSYFKDRATCDRMMAQAMIDCPHCGSNQVRHGLNAPHVQSTKQDEAGHNLSSLAEKNADGAMAAVPPLLDKKLLELKKQLCEHIAKNYDDVGFDFAETAKKMHYGETTAKNIYGKMTAEDAHNLADQGIGFSPLPFMAED